MPKNVEMQKLCKSKAMKASFQWLSAAGFIQNLASQERASPKKRCPPEGDDGGQRQVVMNFIYTPRGHCLCKSSFYFFGRRRNTMWGPSSTAAHAAAHHWPVFLSLWVGYNMGDGGLSLHAHVAEYVFSICYLTQIFLPWWM